MNKKRGGEKKRKGGKVLVWYLNIFMQVKFWWKIEKIRVYIFEFVVVGKDLILMTHMSDILLSSFFVLASPIIA